MTYERFKEVIEKDIPLTIEEYSEFISFYNGISIGHISAIDMALANEITNLLLSVDKDDGAGSE